MALGGITPMHRLRGIDYKRPFSYMVTPKWLPKLAALLADCHRRRAVAPHECCRAAAKRRNSGNLV